MRLDHLLSKIGLYVEHSSDVEIIDMALDSRKVTDGSLFLALQGSNGHGLDYIDEAITNGAVAVLYDQWSGELPIDVPALKVRELNTQIGFLANIFYEYPCQNLQIIGVTGTNGKTTTVHLIAQLAERLGYKVARIGTLGASVGSHKLVGLDRTTPDAVTLFKIFSELQSLEVQVVAMEVSSHALDQYRVHGIPFEVAVMTNLTRDHLDYHGDMDSYGRAKARLFCDFNIRYAVLNSDDVFCKKLADTLSDKEVVTFGNLANDFRIHCIEPTSTGSRIGLSVRGVTSSIELPLLGEFNVQNVLAAVGAVTAIKPQSTDDVLALLNQLEVVPGRMECFKTQESATVVVDYAHTPDALEKALNTCRSHCPGEIWSVFGCGGGRDSGKRPLMGRIASELSDHVVLTSDNPRFESPLKIIGEIRSGMTQTPILEEVDRSKAIQFAVKTAKSKDYILLAGKGHENYQIIGQRTESFSDRIEVTRLLKREDRGAQHAS
ncbi:MAG TPA: UDP-N-acetylmuramoyl-L-alanyl-D-glutamate--2,6-diaminopimelate ligase [Gammaproteobacteria bacterium]|nr:UDP-N-acetylmuramoyl-L-alanyl-D-glutamate--2,6-diaminopimelate ligase [Gammaproteobacteria bacterium]